MGWSSIVLLTVLAASVSGIRRTILHNVEIGPVKPDKGDTVNFKLYLKDSWRYSIAKETDFYLVSRSSKYRPIRILLSSDFIKFSSVVNNGWISHGKVSLAEGKTL
eukprot:sb/3477774/